jgi:hypothetical protein
MLADLVLVVGNFGVVIANLVPVVINFNAAIAISNVSKLREMQLNLVGIFYIIVSKHLES